MQISRQLKITHSVVSKILKKYHQEIKDIISTIEEKLVQQNGSIPIAIPEEEITTENPQMEFLPHLDAEQRDVEFDVDEFLSEISRSHLSDLYLYI